MGGGCKGKRSSIYIVYSLVMQVCVLYTAHAPWGPQSVSFVERSFSIQSVHYISEISLIHAQHHTSEPTHIAALSLKGSAFTFARRLHVTWSPTDVHLRTARSEQGPDVAIQKWTGAGI